MPFKVVTANELEAMGIPKNIEKSVYFHNCQNLRSGSSHYSI